MSKILFFPLLAKYSQRARPKRNAYFIHKTISVREKIAQIHTNTQRSYCDVMPLLRMVRNCTTVEWYAASQRLSSNRRVHNKLSRCCTIRIVEYESLWDNLGMSDIKRHNRKRAKLSSLRSDCFVRRLLGGISSSVLSVIFTDKLYKRLKSLHLIG